MALGPKHVSLAKLEMRVAAAGLAIVVMAGCSMMNPYNHESLEEVPPPAGLRLAGDASEGVKAAEDLRQKYYKNLSSTSYVRSSTGLAAGVLSGWAIYNALKPGASASSASPGDTRRGVRLGVTLGVLYGLRQFFVNPEQESIYAEGYRALTCLMLESSPLLMTESTEKISMPPNGGTAAADILLPPYTEKPLGDLDRLELALDRLERRILDLNVQLATDETIANAIAGEDKGIRSAQWALRDQFERTKKVLAYSRNALADGRTLVRTIKGAGRDIRDRAGIIAGTVNTQVQGKQHGARQSSWPVERQT